MKGTITYKFQGRSLICTLTACVLTVVLMGGICGILAPAAQRAALLQA